MNHLRRVVATFIALLVLSTWPVTAQVVYTDTDNGYRATIPADFKLQHKGAITDWQGPSQDGGASTISVSITPMKGVPPGDLYQTSYKPRREDFNNYTEVVPVFTVKLQGKPVMAFRCKETYNVHGTLNEKKPGDIHRWQLFVFGNDRVYTWTFTGMYATFKANRLQSIFDHVIDSVGLVPVK